MKPNHTKILVDLDILEEALKFAWLEGMEEAIDLIDTGDVYEYSSDRAWLNSESRRAFLSAFMPELMN